MADKINLTVSSSPEDIAEYMSVVRLTTSALANKLGFDVEEIDDIKVSIGEACTNIIKQGLNKGEESFNIEYSVYSDKLKISVKGNGKGLATSDIKEPQVDDIEKLDENGLGIFIIKSLMDEVEIKSDKGQGTEITMTKIKIA